MAAVSQKLEGAVDHFLVAQLLDGDQVVRLQAVGDQGEFRVVARAGGEDADVPGGDFQLLRLWPEPGQ